MAADDVAEGVSRTSLGQPVDGVVEIAGPGQFALDDFVRTGLALRNDSRHVVTDPRAPYHGAVVTAERILVPDDVDAAQIFQTRFTDRLARR
ncbi:hypothetical protein [Nocardia sp. NPDC004750]